MFGTDLYHIYIARVLAGVCGAGSFLVIPVYVMEITSDIIRGFLGSILLLSLNSGILASYIICSLTEYFIVAYIGVTVALTAIALWFTLHDSPIHLINIGKIDKGVKEWEYFHNEKFNGDVKIEKTTKFSINYFSKFIFPRLE